MGKSTPPGQRLRAFRRDRDLSGQAIADAIGCTKGTVSYWESGKTSLPWTVCLALEASFGVSARWLYRAEPPMWVVPERTHPKTGKRHTSIPFLGEEVGFGPDGSAIQPHPESLSIGFQPALLDQVLGNDPPPRKALFLWRVQDDAMEPSLPLGSWVLVDTSPEARRTLTENGIYLLRLGQDPIPTLRRLATDPLSGDLLVSTDAPGRVPLAVHLPAEGNCFAILAHAFWVGRIL
jgi:transcriptional regulator with XRE-family HTH domain